MNQSCVWVGITWIFDVNPDGSIPEPKFHQKQYPAIPDHTDQVQEMLDRELKRSQKPNR